MSEVSNQMQAVITALGNFASFGTDDALWEALRRPGACDFMFGNPHEPASQAYVDALVRGAQPTGKDHYAYTQDLPEATAAIAAGLRDRLGMAFGADDIHMTNGNFAGLAIALRLIIDVGDEVIFVSPPWFFYETLIVASGGTPVRVYADRARSFDLDLAAIEAAITPRTRAIIVNSPHNPSGRIYGPTLLTDLRACWMRRRRATIGGSSCCPTRPTTASCSRGTRSRARWPTTRTRSCCTRTRRRSWRRAHASGTSRRRPGCPRPRSFATRCRSRRSRYGWAYPVSLLQHAVPDLDAMSVDIPTLQRRRDLLVSTLREQGYEAVEPEGTFYIIVRSPLEDDERFCEMLAAHDVFVLPGAMFEMPGWFRISVTANDDMVERALPGFAKAMQEAR